MAGDPNWTSVALLLHGKGADGSTAIVDSSTAARAVTVNGNARIRTAQSKFNGSALYFDGTGDSLALASDVAFSSSNRAFTVEAFVYPEALGRVMGVVSKRPPPGNLATEWQFGIHVTGALFFTGWNAANQVVVAIDTAAAVTAGAWWHIAASRDAGGTWRVFCNGVKIGQATETGITGPNAFPLAVGTDPSSASGREFQGYIAEARFTSGVCRYAADFSVPAEAFPDGRGHVKGTVKASGAGVARTLRAYRRDTGALVANTASDAAGNFSFYTSTLDELTVIALDDAAGTVENDLALRVIPA